MVSGGTVRSDLSSIKNILNKCNSEFSSLASSWKGVSYDSLSSKVSEFVTEYSNSLNSSMEAFAIACDDYLEYIQLKGRLETAKENLSLARDNLSIAKENGDSDKVSVYLSDINRFNVNISTLESNISSLKTKIESNLQIASSV